MSNGVAQVMRRISIDAVCQETGDAADANIGRAPSNAGQTQKTAFQIQQYCSIIVKRRERCRASSDRDVLYRRAEPTALQRQR